jgi:ribosome-associated protein
MEKIFIDTEFIRLDSALKLAGAVESGGQAKYLIQNGEVSVCGGVCLMRGKKLRAGDVFSIGGIDFTVCEK